MINQVESKIKKIEIKSENKKYQTSGTEFETTLIINDTYYINGNFSTYKGANRFYFQCSKTHELKTDLINVFGAKNDYSAMSDGHTIDFSFTFDELMQALWFFDIKFNFKTVVCA